MRVLSFVCVSVLALASALPAVAQERSFSFALRAGLAVAPAFPGSDEYEPGGDLGFSFGALKFGRVNLGNGVRGVPANGFGVRGALAYIGERDVSEYEELSGLDDIDDALELGIAVTYQETNWSTYAEVRKGIGGHSGVTGTLGADFIFRPSERWLIKAGPRMNFGDSEYASTYFGISESEAAGSSFSEYDASGGALGAELELQASYFLSDRWALEGAVSYEKLINDAGDSPITAIGSEDQWRLRLGVSRVFTLNF